MVFFHEFTTGVRYIASGTIKVKSPQMLAADLYSAASAVSFAPGTMIPTDITESIMTAHRKTDNAFLNTEFVCFISKRSFSRPVGRHGMVPRKRVHRYTMIIAFQKVFFNNYMRARIYKINYIIYLN